MRPPLTALLLAAGLVLAALAGCGKKPEDDKKNNKDNPAVNPGDPKGSGKDATPVGPPEKVEVGHKAQDAAHKLILALRKGEAVEHPAVSARFLKVIGKPLDDIDRMKGAAFNEFQAREWLRREAAGFGADAQVAPPFSGFGRGGIAVFTSTFTNARVAKGRYLVRMVEEGGAWKLDWFQVSGVASNDPAPPANAETPFQDFVVQAAADLVGFPPGSNPDLPPATHQAPLAAAILSPKLRAELKVNKDKPDDLGYDYDRAWLAGKMDLFLDSGKKVTSYTRAAAGPDLFRVDFTLEGGAKKSYHVKLVSGGGPGLWLVDEFTALP